MGDLRERLLPGTTTTYFEKGQKGFSKVEMLILATGGLNLSQVCSVTGLEGSTIQNWVKRGWVANPRGKKYDELHIARILIINALKECIKLEHIALLMSYVNGSTDDKGKAIIKESELFNYLCDALERLGEVDDLSRSGVEAIVEAVVEDYTGPLPDARERISKALTVMIYACVCTDVKRRTEAMMSQVLNELRNPDMIADSSAYTQRPKPSAEKPEVIERERAMQEINRLREARAMNIGSESSISKNDESETAGSEKTSSEHVGLEKPGYEHGGLRVTGSGSNGLKIAIRESAASEVAVSGNAAPDSSVSESIAPEAAVSESVVSEIAASEGAVPEAAISGNDVPEAAIHESAKAERAAMAETRADSPVPRRVRNTVIISDTDSAGASGDGAEASGQTAVRRTVSQALREWDRQVTEETPESGKVTAASAISAADRIAELAGTSIADEKGTVKKEDVAGAEREKSEISGSGIGSASGSGETEDNPEKPAAKPVYFRRG